MAAFVGGVWRGVVVCAGWLLLVLVGGGWGGGGWGGGGWGGGGWGGGR